jgi:hypothetical protein
VGSDRPTVHQSDGDRGGEYFYVDLSDGRRLLVSRKKNDHRVWLGRPDEPKSYDQQLGGIGRIDKLLDQWRAQIALDDESAELYWALSALDSSRRV